MIRDAVDSGACEALAAALAGGPHEVLRRRGGQGYAARQLLRDVPAVMGVLRSAPLRDVILEVLGGGAFAVRAILFDKVPGANWLVAWHQDRAIAVRERRDAPGFGPWSIKAGTPHVQPTAAVLERMLTVRIHLDGTPMGNGPLRVSPGTHRLGFIEGGQISDTVKAHGTQTLDMPARSVVLMRPLLLHASSPSDAPTHRRVIHVELAGFALPHGLEWHERLMIA